MMSTSIGSQSSNAKGVAASSTSSDYTLPKQCEVDEQDQGREIIRETVEVSLNAEAFRFTLEDFTVSLGDNFAFCEKNGVLAIA